MSLLTAALERVRVHQPTVSLSSSRGPDRPSPGSRLDLEVRHDHHDAVNCHRRLRARIHRRRASRSRRIPRRFSGLTTSLTRSTCASSPPGARRIRIFFSLPRTSSASAVTSRISRPGSRDGCPEALHSRWLLPLCRRGGASRALTSGPCPPAAARLRVARHRPRPQRARLPPCGRRAWASRRARPHLVARAQRVAGLRSDRCRHRGARP